MSYRIIYYVGQDLTIKTKVGSGTLTFQDGEVCVSGATAFIIPLSSVVRVEMFRLHGTARMIKMVCKERTIFLTVVRLNLFGYFIITNFFRAGELYESLKRMVQKSQTV